MAKRFGRLAATIGALGMLAAAVACGGGSSPSDSGVIITPITSTTEPVPVGGDTQPQPGSTTTNQPTAVSPATGGEGLHGFGWPVAGGCLPKGDQLMPGAPRDYRQGIHEGVDFYNVDNCTPIAKGTPALAAKAGRVVRADTDYVDLTPATLNEILANPTTADSIDKFRGRQVWIDHDNGIVTRYVHLSGIAAGIVPGVSVTQGQVVGYVGESGTPESVTTPGSELHLHFELRLGAGCAAASAAQLVNCGYLGQGQTPSQVRALYQTLFSP